MLQKYHHHQSRNGGCKLSYSCGFILPFFLTLLLNRNDITDLLAVPAGKAKSEAAAQVNNHPLAQRY